MLLVRCYAMPHSASIARLKAAGGWDPYNVTEDADLGFRLARAGYGTMTIASTTWEEAPIRLESWIKQRTRWLKGWMQTYLVHTRQPARARRELGWRGWLALHGLIGGMMLSTLVHPICLAAIGYQVAGGGLLTPGDSVVGRVLVWIAIVNLVLGYASAMMAGAIAAWRRGWRRTSLAALAMPLYWQLISIASYRALWQLFRAPHLWEKPRTATRVARRVRVERKNRCGEFGFAFLAAVRTGLVAPEAHLSVRRPDGCGRRAAAMVDVRSTVAAPSAAENLPLSPQERGEGEDF